MRLAPLAVLASLALSASGHPSLHLIPMPREVKAGTSLPLNNGIRVDCAQPCDPEDAFAVADLKAALAERRIQTTEAGNVPHIFVTRFSTNLGKQIYREANGTGSAFPAEM